ncbi:RDD family protein [Rubripirellula reticaptiva]|uniref:RDD family protein n=1 Tax=Rubripirellula reticaptiva TaxID=2528013 RepID=A0A5C6EF36_9BACT|nr:RDD family protein [Rubripirellula reticaptiva]TWU47064.1 RDD family protein [Rubripirellula reticaptiva]
MKIKCPACATVLNVPDTAAGKVVKCPCGKQLRAPGGTAGPASGAAAARPAAAPAARRPTEPATTTRRPAPAGNDFDPGLFDELTEADLQPVKMASTGPKSSNPYAPTAHGGGASFGGPVASVGKRFFGAFIDGAVYFVATFISTGLFFLFLNIQFGTIRPENPPAYVPIVNLAFTLTAMIIVTGINISMICKSGQSIGKKAAGSRIVMESDRQLPGFVHGWLIRSFGFGLLSSLLFNLPALVDALFVFSDNARTLHDRMASTIVVDA